MWVWYKDAIDRPLPPDRVTIAHITVEQVELYCKVLAPGQPTPVGFHTSPIVDYVPKH